jgi:hypothetical protein
MPDNPSPFNLQLGPTQIRAKNVRLRADILLDEVNLESENAEYAAPATPGEEARIHVEELKAQIVLSEPNLNAIVAANLPPSAPVRNLRIALFTGKMKITGQIVKLITIPFTLEATLLIASGVRIVPDFLNVNASVIPLPASAVEIIEKFLRPTLTIDLAKLPIPVWLDAVRCEPGRLIAEGRARLHWPPAVTPAPRPFSAPLPLESASVPALPAPDDQRPTTNDE